MAIVWSAVIALAAAASAGADDDEGLKDLATRVARLEAERQEAAAAKEKQEDAKSMSERVAALEKKLGGAGQTYDSSKMLTFSTPDGNFTAKIGGRLYTVYRHIFDAGQNGSNAKDSFFIDTARFQLDGTFFKDFYYRVEGEAKSGETVNGVVSTGFFRTKDAYLGWQGLGDRLGLQMGQFKQPMSQEETCSSRFIDFAERSILNRLIPGHVQGVMLKGAFFDRTIEWFLGFNNGPVARGSVDTNDEKGEFFRLFITPLKDTEMALFKTMRLGFDVSDGKINNSVVAGGGLGAVRSGDLGIPNILQFTPGAAFVQGHLTRMDLNFSWNYGPMSLRAEYFRQCTQLESAAANAYEIAAWYVQATSRTA